MSQHSALISNPTKDIAERLKAEGFSEVFGRGEQVSNGQFSISQDEMGRSIFHVGVARLIGPGGDNPYLTGNMFNKAIGNKQSELREAGGIFTQPTGVLGRGWEMENGLNGQSMIGSVMQFAVASPDKAKEINAANIINSFKNATPMMGGDRPKLDGGMKPC